MSERPHLTAVICAFHRQFINWCHDNDRNPRDPSLCLVQREEQARGRIFDEVIQVGDYQPHLLRAAESRLQSRLGVE